MVCVTGMGIESSNAKVICGGYGDNLSKATVIAPVAAAVPDLVSLSVRGIPVPVTTM
jgi:hypothetical protein